MFVFLFLCLNLIRFIILIFLFIKFIFLVTLIWPIILLIFIRLCILFCLSLRFLSRKRRTSKINWCLIIIFILWDKQLFIRGANHRCYISINIFKVNIIILLLNVRPLIFIFEINFISHPCLCKNSSVRKETSVIITGESCLVLQICLYRIKFLCVFMYNTSIFLFRRNSIYFYNIFIFFNLLTLIVVFFIY